MNLHNVEFIKSAAASSGFIDDGLPQIVFAGRSNVGKSSVINRVLNRKALARTSSAPGKTVHVNYYLVDRTAYLVDLPGYGYAKVSKQERDRWSRLMEAFFSAAHRITLGVLIVDARHKPTQDDVIMARWFVESSRPAVVVANKIDKVRKSEVDRQISQIRETLGLPETTGIIAFSAETGLNRDILLDKIEIAANA